MSTFLIATILLLATLTFFYSIMQFDLFRTYWSAIRKPKQPGATLPSLPEVLPRVTIQLPMYNESAVAERMLEAVAAIEYPRELLQIQVLDDSTDHCSEILQRKVEEIHSRFPDLQMQYRHRVDRTGYKAGNLDEGNTWSTGEFTAIFDADFVPQPDYLLKTLPHFQNPEIAIVQSRWAHLNGDASIVTQLQRHFLDGHLSVEQRGRFEGGHCLIYNGSAGIWRKSVVLDCGGWKTTAAIEDVDMSYRAQLKGHKIIYLEDYTTPGELPDSMIALRLQLFRWWKGGLQIGLMHIRDVWKSNFSFHKKMHATVHLLAPLMAIIGLLNILVFGPLPLVMVDNATDIFLLRASLIGATIVPCMLMIYGTGRYRFMEGQRRTGIMGLVENIYLGALLIILHSGLLCQNAVAAMQAFMKGKNVWVVTPKGFANGSGQARKAPKVKVPWYVWLDALVIAYLAASIYLSFSAKLYFLSCVQMLWLVSYLWVFGMTMNEAYGARIAERLMSFWPGANRQTASDFAICDVMSTVETKSTPGAF